ncbi:MAG: threonine synthase [candidate division Zixibacteria bacterium RBG_16_50_21]|nr:MAG: threonine synthase [candidate division Zixibacteria bacterium RBG_16_50_21]
MSFLTHLECVSCSGQYRPNQPHNLCACGSPLFARYELQEVSKTLSPEKLARRDRTLWRYRELLPVESEVNVISLGEGVSPLIQAKKLGRKFGLESLFLKDETFQPTGSFKARGMAVAISKAKELGIRKICLPSAGNAGSAAAAYSAAAGLEAFVFMPEDVEEVCQQECQAYGAVLDLAGKSIRDSAQAMNAHKQPDWFDISTLKEPYRVEGKKIMGYEIAEQMGWQLPDAIFYPTGGGTGLIGMWKAFGEMEELGWIGSKKPRMFVVQAEGCAPIVKAFKENQERSQECQNPQTQATGIKVPKALADFLILRIVRESKGEAVSVREEQIQDSFRLCARQEGMMFCPEGAAALAGLQKLAGQGKISPGEKVVVFNTGSAIKYPSFLKQVLG